LGRKEGIKILPILTKSVGLEESGSGVSRSCYSGFDHLVLSICTGASKGSLFAMTGFHTVYVDDSGTDPKSNIVSAAFCVSTVGKWKSFEDSWSKIAKRSGFELKQFHMTEFAACRSTNPCRQCLSGKTSTKDHPWQRWSQTKRDSVLRQMAKAIVRHCECGFGIACTKKDYDEHVKNSPARSVANEPIGDQHFTFPLQVCGGELARWRSANRINAPLKFVFDLPNDAEKREIVNVFFAAAHNREKDQDGIEQWFETDGISYESKKSVPQLLAADMLAWAIATLRAREVFRTGRNFELYQVADVLLSSEHIKLGRIEKDTLAKWEQKTLLEAENKPLSAVQQD